MFKTSMEKCYAVREEWVWRLSLFFSVSQFTLLASTKKGSKPDFHGALGGDQAKELYQVFFSKVQQGYDASRVKDGVFQAMMVSFSVLIAIFSNKLSGGSLSE